MSFDHAVDTTILSRECFGFQDSCIGKVWNDERNLPLPRGVSSGMSSDRAQANMFSNIPAKEKVWQLIKEENIHSSVTLQ